MSRSHRVASATVHIFCRLEGHFIAQMSIDQIHIYNSRSKAFSDDGILQENVILAGRKNMRSLHVTVTSSNDPLDSDVLVHRIRFDELIDRRDPNMVFKLLTNSNDRRINKIISGLDCTLSDLQVRVSTGQVVDFRSRHLLRKPKDANSVPLILPIHLVDGFVKWPIEKLKKPSAIDYVGGADKLLIRNNCYVLVKRFSSKEQRRRLTAAVLDPGRLDFEHVGIENHLNYFHRNGSGLPLDLAKGLAAYLNSTILDHYFRLFSGHTQVNATDLRSLKYPNLRTLSQLGKRIGECFPDQEVLDKIVTEELGMQEENAPLNTQVKIESAIEILKSINAPNAQLNSRSALTLLSLVDIKPNDKWPDAKAPLRRIIDMMEFFSAHYGTTYKPNTRETIRRQSIHQFWQMGIVVHNPDDPDRAINSPHYCYQVEQSFLELIKCFGSPAWEQRLTLFQIEAGDRLTSLTERKRTMRTIPVSLPDGTARRLTSGGQNQLIKSIVEEFCPRFARGGEVLYLGDAGDKLNDSQVRRFQDLGISLDRHGKTPDVVVYLDDKNWLILIEAVTSHGPVDRKRQNELRELFSKGSAGLVFVTAFQSRKAMAKYLVDISWETEVWMADSPDHLIHFDGERFLGPYAGT